MVWQDGGWFTLDICVVTTESCERAQSVEDCVKGVPYFVGQGGFGMFSAGEEVITKRIERLAA